MNEEHSDESTERRREIQRTINAYHRTFETPDGKLVLADMAKAFGWDRPAFLNLTAGKGEIRFDSIHAATRDGQRSIQLHIAAKLAVPVQGDANIQKKRKPKVRRE